MTKQRDDDLTNPELLSQLRSAGVACASEGEFDSFAGLTDAFERILVAERSPGPGAALWPSHGISFWLHAGGGFLFLGVWTGIVYRLYRPSLAIPLVTDILSGEYIKKGSPPYSVPQVLIDKYGLRRCEFLCICRTNACERLEDVEKKDALLSIGITECFAQLETRLDTCRSIEGGFVELGIGSASAVVRFPCEEYDGRQGLPLLVYGAFGITPDHSRLLHAVVTALNCVLYHTGWGNRIHLDDPYYSYRVGKKRPEEPRNAWIT